jgi:hypothetical protein
MSPFCGDHASGALHFVDGREPISRERGRIAGRGAVDPNLAAISPHIKVDDLCDQCEKTTPIFLLENAAARMTP